MLKNRNRFCLISFGFIALCVFMCCALEGFAQDAFNYDSEPFQAEVETYVEPPKPDQYPGTPIETPWLFIGCLVIGYAVSRYVAAKSKSANCFKCKRVAGMSNQQLNRK